MARPSPAVPFVLTGLIALGAVSTDLYLPALPSMTSELGGDTSDGQLTLSLFLAGMALGQLFYGPFSDRFGRKTALYIGMTVYAAGSIACALSKDIEFMWFARFVQGLGASVGPALGRAIVADLYRGKEAAKTMSSLASAMAILPLVAPTLGAVIILVAAWASLFWILFGFGLALLFAIVYLLPESLPDRQASQHGAEKIPFSTSEFWVLTLIGVSSFCILFAFVSGNSFFLIKHFSLSPIQQGIGFGVTVLGYALGSQASARINHRFSVAGIMVAGGIIATLGGVWALGAALLDGAVGWYAPGALGMFFGAGLTFANAQAELVRLFIRSRGLTSAGFGFLQLGLGAAYGAVVGVLLEWNLVFGLVLPMSLAGLILLFATLWWQRSQSTILVL